MRFCPKCKVNYEDSVTFCLEDGTVLKPLDSTIQSIEKSGEETFLLPKSAIPPTQSWKDIKKSQQKKSKRQGNQSLPKTQLISKNQQKNRAAPLVIIGLVLVIAVGGGWWLFKSSTAPKPKANANQPTNRPQTPDGSAQKYATAPPGAQPPNMLGAPTATVTIEEFADFQCGTCALKYPMAKELIQIYGPRIKFIFRNYPLAIPAHDKAYDAAVAAEAAGMQNKFWDMENQLFTNQATWSGASDFRKILEEYAVKIGLDVEKFKNDMAGTVAKSRVDNDVQRGKSLGISSTPSFFVNGKLVPFDQVDTSQMRAIIDAELQKAQTSNQNSPANTQNK